MTRSTSRKPRPTSWGSSRIYNRIVALTAFAVLLPALTVAQETPDATFSLKGYGTVNVSILAGGNYESVSVGCSGPFTFQTAVVTRVHGGMRIRSTSERICGLPMPRAAVVEALTSSSQSAFEYALRTAQYRRTIAFQNTGISPSGAYRITGRSALDKASEITIAATVAGGALSEATVSLSHCGSAVTHLVFQRKQGSPIGTEMLYPFVTALMEQHYRSAARPSCH